MKRTFSSAFFSVIGGKLVLILVSFLITPFIVRLLGASSYGRYATVMAFFGLLMIPVSSGINSGNRKYIAENREDANWKAHVFGFYLRLGAVFALLAAGALLAAAQIGLVDRVLGEEFALYFYLLGVLVLASQFGEFTRRTLMGLQLEHISEPISVVYKVAFGIFAITLAYLGYGVPGVLVGYILANLLKAIISLYFIRQVLPLSTAFSGRPDWFPTGTLLDFNHLSVIYIFMLTSLYHVDVLMLELFTTSERVGYYKIALVVVEFLWVVPRSLQAVMVQETSELWRRGEVDRISQLSSRVTRFTLALTMLLAVGIAVLADRFVPIYAGPAYIASVPALLLLLPGTIGFAISRPILTISHAKGDLHIMIYATGLSAILNLVLNATLIPSYGIEGAAIATSIGYGSLPVFHIIGARTLGYHPASDLRMGRIILTGTATAAVIYPLALIIESTLLAFLVVPPVGLAVYGTLTIVTGVISAREIFLVLDDMPGPISRRAAAIQRRLET